MQKGALEETFVDKRWRQSKKIIFLFFYGNYWLGYSLNLVDCDWLSLVF